MRRAELDVAAPTSWSGAIIAQQNVLLLDEARQRLAQLELDVKSHARPRVASAAVLREKRNKAQLAGRGRRRNIDSLRVRAPFDGFVTVRPNYHGLRRHRVPAAPMPEYRVGDATFPGSPSPT